MEVRIQELVAAANRAGLEGIDFLWQFDNATLDREYNGIGPEWAGPAIRDKATDKLALFEPAALIHDLRNYESDGSEEGFIFANREFLDNCLKLANHAYPWWSWRRYRARAVAFALYEFVQGAGGWIAWKQCADKNLSRQGLRPSTHRDERCWKSKITRLHQKELRQVQRESLNLHDLHVLHG